MISYMLKDYLGYRICNSCLAFFTTADLAAPEGRSDRASSRDSRAVPHEQIHLWQRQPEQDAQVLEEHRLYAILLNDSYTAEKDVCLN